MNTAVENLSATENESLDEALAALDDIEEILQDEKEQNAPVSVEPVKDGVLDENELDELDIEIDKAESYASQTSTAVVTVTNEGKKTTTPKKRGARKTRVERDLTALPNSVFVLAGDASKMSDEDLDANKKTVLAMKPVQVKVGEKFDNLFQSIAAGRLPSKYVVDAFKLIDKNKTVSSSEIVAMFKASGLREGTARSQTGQIMVLMNAVGVCDRAGNTLTLNADSNIASFLRDLTPAS